MADRETGKRVRVVKEEVETSRKPRRLTTKKGVEYRSRRNISETYMIILGPTVVIVRVRR